MLFVCEKIGVVFAVGVPHSTFTSLQRKFIEYPENPNTHVKEKIEELAKEKAEQRQQRDAYQEQLRELERSAQRAQRKHQLYLSGDKENDTNSIDTGVAGGGGERASRSIWGRVAGWFPGNSA